MGRLRVRLAADYERLEFLRVLRHHGVESVADSNRVVGQPSTQSLLNLPTSEEARDE